MAAPITNQPNDFWYNPQNDYGWGNLNYPNTPLGDIDLNEFNREGAWTDYLVRNGFGGTNTNAELGRSLWTRANQGYAGARTKNPILHWTDYLKNLDISQISASMSPSARGENTQRYVGPLRYQFRQQ